jgi:hypothetical protein
MAKLFVPAGVPDQTRAGDELPPAQPRPFITKVSANVLPSVISGLVSRKSAPKDAGAAAKAANITVVPIRMILSVF